MTTREITIPSTTDVKVTFLQSALESAATAGAYALEVLDWGGGMVLFELLGME
jgi:hypothetical protein